MSKANVREEVKERVNSNVKWHATVGINCMVRLLKQVVDEAAGEKIPEA
jgi:hypothetical protein